jgi:hypothetical protein
MHCSCIVLVYLDICDFPICLYVDTSGMFSFMSVLSVLYVAPESSKYILLNSVMWECFVQLLKRLFISCSVYTNSWTGCSVIFIS